MDCQFEMVVDINGFTLNLSVSASAHIYRENYGADADGNRGEMMTFCDDLNLSILDGHNKDITNKLEERYPYVYETVLTAAENTLCGEYNKADDYDGGYEPDPNDY